MKRTHAPGSLFADLKTKVKYLKVPYLTDSSLRYLKDDPSTFEPT